MIGRSPERQMWILRAEHYFPQLSKIHSLEWIHSLESGGMRAQHRRGASGVPQSFYSLCSPFWINPKFREELEYWRCCNRWRALSHLPLQPVYWNGWPLSTVVCLHLCHKCYGIQGESHISFIISAEIITGSGLPEKIMCPPTNHQDHLSHCD